MKIYKAAEAFCDRIMAGARPLAYPGRGVRLPSVLIIALPKSGSIYLQRALRRTLRVQIQSVGAAGLWGSRLNYETLLRFEKGNLLSREHMQPRPIMLKLLAAYGIRRVVLHLRDPRAAIVSWAKHMDRSLERGRGLPFVELSCDMEIPDEYLAWSFDQRLHWQVQNMLPRFVRWTEDWVALVEQSRDVKFLVTEYSELNVDARGLIRRILEFNEIDHAPDWIKLPVVRVGRNNIFTPPDPAGVAKPGWIDKMRADTLESAGGMVPGYLLDRFNWPRV